MKPYFRRRRKRFVWGRGLNSLLKNSQETSGAKALSEKKGLIAALKALRHPKESFSANCERLCLLWGCQRAPEGRSSMLRGGWVSRYKSNANGVRNWRQNLTSKSNVKIPTLSLKERETRMGHPMLGYHWAVSAVRGQECPRHRLLFVSYL